MEIIMKNFLKICSYEIKSLFLLLTQTKNGAKLTVKHHTPTPVSKQNQTLKRVMRWWN